MSIRLGLIGCGEERHALTVAFAPDGQTLAVGYGPNKGMVQIWKLRPLERLEQWSGQEKFTRTAVFSPDGRMLATGGSDDLVWLWGLTDQVFLRTDWAAPVARFSTNLRPFAR